MERKKLFVSLRYVNDQNNFSELKKCVYICMDSNGAGEKWVAESILGRNHFV